MIRKTKKEKKEKNMLPIVIIASLLVAAIVYVVLLNVEKKALTDFEKGAVYVSAKPIPKGFLITAENADEYFVQTEMDKTLIPEAAVSSPEDLDGLVSAFAMDQGTLVTRGMFIAVSDITKDMEQPVIAGFKAEDLYQVVGGVLRAGDRINIYQVEDDKSRTSGIEESGWTESPASAASLVWGNVFVQDVFDSAGEVIDAADRTTPAQRINIYMDDRNIAEFYAALAQGSLRVVKICE